ncbi:MAG: hypothetical protein M1527_01705 [Gammaproteobacteria bacterium]|nr:hypothetical protein [Gammaproteobacteria bacterium]
MLAFALWLGRKLIVTRLAKSVEHEFNTKLEAVRAEFREKDELLKADLRLKESEIAALRGGAMTAMASRQMAVDKRRLEAVDQLWSAVTALASAKGISAFMAVMKFEAVAEEAARNAEFRKMFTIMGGAIDITKVDVTGAAKARPFVSAMAWALYSAYSAIAMHAVMRLHIIKSGIGAKDLFDKDAVAKLVKAALPHQAGYIDKYGDAGYHYLLEELEESLLAALRTMLAGEEADRASVERAAEIVRLSEELKAKQSTVQQA